MTESILLSTGLVLLGLAALTGFLQARTPRDSDAFHRWRVVHAGGTGGGVQLLALSAIWNRLPQSSFASWVVLGVACATWIFFLGPLANALERPQLAKRLNWLGALIAAPAYLALPLLLIL